MRYVPGLLGAVLIVVGCALILPPGCDRRRRLPAAIDRRIG